MLIRILVALLLGGSLLLNCGQRSTTEKATGPVHDSLIHCLRQLPMLTGKVDNDLSDSIGRTDRPKIDRNKDGWLFGLEHVDSTQFEKADNLCPIGRLFESDKGMSVLFYDFYDYKMAFHVFNFRKSDMTPVSSHVVFDIGGDADDFWYKDAAEISPSKFEVTEIVGRYETQGAQIIFRQKKEVRFDEMTGKKKSVVLSTAQNVYDKYFHHY